MTLIAIELMVFGWGGTRWNLTFKSFLVPPHVRSAFACLVTAFNPGSEVIHLKDNEENLIVKTSSLLKIVSHRQSILMSLVQQSLSVLQESPSPPSPGEVYWYPTYSSPWFSHFIQVFWPPPPPPPPMPKWLERTTSHPESLFKDKEYHGMAARIGSLD